MQLVFWRFKTDLGNIKKMRNYLKWIFHWTCTRQSHQAKCAWANDEFPLGLCTDQDVAFVLLGTVTPMSGIVQLPPSWNHKLFSKMTLWDILKLDFEKTVYFTEAFPNGNWYPQSGERQKGWMMARNISLHWASKESQYFVLVKVGKVKKWE